MASSFDHYLKKASRLSHAELLNMPYTFFNDYWVMHVLENEYCMDCKACYRQYDGNYDCDYDIFDENCAAARHVRKMFARMFAFQEMVAHDI